MNHAPSCFARLALLTIAVAGSLHASNTPAPQSASSATAASTRIYVGHDAVRKELEVLEQVISDTTTRVVKGDAESPTLHQLLDRRASLQKMLDDPQLNVSGYQSQAIAGCGQTLQLSVNAFQSPGGSANAFAASGVQLDASYPAKVQGLLYSIAKNALQTDSDVRTFSHNSAKEPTGVYYTSSNQSLFGAWASCGKAYATGTISDLEGNTHTCGTVPLILETEYQYNTTLNCSSAF